MAPPLVKTDSNVDILIWYCRTCGFEALAKQISEALSREFGAGFGLKIECRPSYWGCFRIEHQGIEIFNRWKTRGWRGRFGFGRVPSPDEVIELIRERLDSGKPQNPGTS